MNRDFFLRKILQYIQYLYKYQFILYGLPAITITVLVPGIKTLAHGTCTETNYGT
jgi:hypothetical protein